MRKPHNYCSEDGLSGFDGLAVAIVIQAVCDWRYLCDGYSETPEKNFAELDKFFVETAPLLLCCHKTKAREIHKLLLEEKKAAGIEGSAFTPKPFVSKLQYLKTGTDWSKQR